MVLIIYEELDLTGVGVYVWLLRLTKLQYPYSVGIATILGSVLMFIIT